MTMTSIVFTSCRQNEPFEDDDNGIHIYDMYHLPANLTRDEINDLIRNAQRKLSEISRISVVTLENWNWVQTNEEYRLRRRNAYDAYARRFIQVIYRTPRGQQEYVRQISYVNGDNHYFYFFSAGNVRREIRRPTSNAAQYYFENDTGNWMSPPSGNYEFTIENGKAIFRNRHNTDKRTYIFNANKQIRKQTVQRENETRIRNVEHRIYTYGVANVTLPSGFSVSSFTDDRRSEYFAINVIWGEGKGENTFWVTPFSNATYANLWLWQVARSAPRIAGRSVVGFTVGDETYRRTQIQVTDNNTTINVIWE